MHLLRPVDIQRGFAMIEEEDTASISSTFDAQAPNKTALNDDFDHHHEKSISRRRRVRINEDLNVSYENVHMYHEDCEDLWYAAEDYHEFKMSNTEAAKDIIRHQTEQIIEASASSSTALSPAATFRTLLEHVFDACRSTETENNSTANIDEHDDYLAWLTQMDEGYLTQWVATTIEEPDDDDSTSLSLMIHRLGLERSIIRQIRLDKRTRRLDIVNRVLDIQDEHNYYMPSPEEEESRAILIANAARSVSRPSRLFATYLARLQECYVL